MREVFFNAVKNGNLEKLHDLRVQAPGLVNNLDQGYMEYSTPNTITKVPRTFGSQGFLLAAEYGQVAVMGLILDLNAKCINAIDDMGDSALFIAAKHGKIEVMMYLLSIDQNLIDSINMKGKNIFLYAAEHGRIEVMKYILNKKPELINSVDENKENEYSDYEKGFQPLNAWASPRDINIAALLMAYDIKGFLPPAKEQGLWQMLGGKEKSASYLKRQEILPEWLSLLGLQNEGDFSLLRDEVTNFGKNLIFIGAFSDMRSLNKYMPNEVVEYIVKIAANSLASESRYSNLFSAILKDSEALEQLKQRCAREILQEVYPHFIGNHSPELNYIEELQKARNLDHILKASEFMADIVINKCRKHNSGFDKLPAAEEISSWIAPVLGGKSEQFENYVSQELRSDLMNIMYQALVKHYDASKEEIKGSIISGVDKAIDECTTTEPQFSREIKNANKRVADNENTSGRESQACKIKKQDDKDRGDEKRGRTL
ncbi:ankyrin repeat domain-containing protein [Holosporaceae bacterium 'Namur']|nr:ankyrin repeat domain-containing protein [Holosporaceae bacterium 'Namur']